MTTLTESPEDALKSAIMDVEEANQWVARRKGAMQKAQTRANDAQNFVVAAALEYQNADARFLVLQELFEKQNLLESNLADAEEELEHAKATQSSVSKTLAALKKATAAAQKLVDGTATAVTELGTLQASLASAAEEAPNGHKAPLTNAARKVNTLHTRLGTERDKLQKELDAASADYDAVPALTGVKDLEDRVAALRKKLDAVNAEKGKGPAVTKADVEKAEVDRNNAQLLNDQAPQAAQDAQDDLRAKQTELSGAQTTYNAAVQAFEQVEEKFIDRIVVSDPDATGWALARAVLKPDITIPAGYQLQWQAGGAPITYPDKDSTLTVRIDANALPVGDTSVTATIVSDPKS